MPGQARRPWNSQGGLQRLSGRQAPERGLDREEGDGRGEPLGCRISDGSVGQGAGLEQPSVQAILGSVAREAVLSGVVADRMTGEQGSEVKSSGLPTGRNSAWFRQQPHRLLNVPILRKACGVGKIGDDSGARRVRRPRPLCRGLG